MIAKKNFDISKIDPEIGEAILIDKDINKTSFSAVYKVKKILNLKKAGHAGSLDPKATGLLIICFGKHTKNISMYQNLKKTYIGKFCIGKISNTYDLEGEIRDGGDISGINFNALLEAKALFEGEIMQKPPMFSAAKKYGKALYKYARKGIEVEREAKKVSIYRFDILEYDPPYVAFEIECSKGVYIRSIAHDFGVKLGCGAYLHELRRIKIGDYSVDDAFKINELKQIAISKNA
jgi:tRNA pseudouridine55 synthase